jgi:hypothetical protein
MGVLEGTRTADLPSTAEILGGRRHRRLVPEPAIRLTRPLRGARSLTGLSARRHRSIMFLGRRLHLADNIWWASETSEAACGATGLIALRYLLKSQHSDQNDKDPSDHRNKSIVARVTLLCVELTHGYGLMWGRRRCTQRGETLLPVGNHVLDRHGLTAIGAFPPTDHIDPTWLGAAKRPEWGHGQGTEICENRSDHEKDKQRCGKCAIVDDCRPNDQCDQDDDEQHKSNPEVSDGRIQLRMPASQIVQILLELADFDLTMITNIGHDQAVLDSA